MAMKKGREGDPRASRQVSPEGELELMLVSVAVGLALAVAYHLLSVRLQGWFFALQRRFAPAGVSWRAL